MKQKKKTLCLVIHPRSNCQNECINCYLREDITQHVLGYADLLGNLETIHKHFKKHKFTDTRITIMINETFSDQMFFDFEFIMLALLTHGMISFFNVQHIDVFMSSDALHGRPRAIEQICTFITMTTASYKTTRVMRFPTFDIWFSNITSNFVFTPEVGQLLRDTTQFKEDNIMNFTVVAHPWDTANDIKYTAQLIQDIERGLDTDEPSRILLQHLHGYEPKKDEYSYTRYYTELHGYLPFQTIIQDCDHDDVTIDPDIEKVWAIMPNGTMKNCVFGPDDEDNKKFSMKYCEKMCPTKG